LPISITNISTLTINNITTRRCLAEVVLEEFRDIVVAAFSGSKNKGIQGIFECLDRHMSKPRDIALSNISCFGRSNRGDYSLALRSSFDTVPTMADLDVEVASIQPKKRRFKKLLYCWVDLHVLLDMISNDICKFFPTHAHQEA
jgi:hypothetical protein